MSVSSYYEPVTGVAHPFACPGFGRSFRPIQRHRRKAFHPNTDTGPYRLPKALQDRLTASLAGFRNAEAAFTLAVFVARFWTTPGRLEQAFPIDRRALTDHRELGLSEGQVRGAILTLERIGFLDRPITGKGSAYRRKGDELHRKPVLFVFGPDYRAEFATANQRSQAKRQDRKPKPQRVAAPVTNSPKDRNSLKEKLFMGDVKDCPLSPTNDGLENALANLRRAIGIEAHTYALKPESHDSKRNP